MQDIGGLRAIVGTISRVRGLEGEYRATKFGHKLTGSKNYIDHPKDDGYRGVHLIYRYRNNATPDYNGLSLELQFRTKLQHAWATAVETMGTFSGQALKSGQGDEEWRRFFAVASAALAIDEKTAPVPGFQDSADFDVFTELARAERNLRVLEKLRNFAIATEHITTERGQGLYHLIVLDSSGRSVTITPYAKANLEAASLAYSEVEKRTNAGEPIEAVLVAAGPVEDLRKAYPNYFLDTQAFLRRMRTIIERTTAK
jgi:Region found in RelA / SpoT proteins